MSKTAPKHFFSKNASVSMPRTRFDMSCTNTTTITSDYLYPIYCNFVLPGDSWNLGVSNFIRMISPLDVPMMDNLYCDYHFWFVPWRLVWKNAKYFFGEQDRNPESDIDYTIPTVKFNSSVAAASNYVGSTPHAGLPQCGSIYDYFQLPIQGTDKLLSGSFAVNSLPFRAYNLIFDDWYRDEQRVPYSYYNNGDTQDTADKYFLLKRGKRFDYFTSTLLEPQLGEPVDIPLGTSAPVSVYGSGSVLPLTDGSMIGSLISSSDYLTFGVNSNVYQGQPVGGNVSFSTGYQHGRFGVPTKSQLESSNGSTGRGTDSGLVGTCDLSNATAATVASLRQAFQMQAYQELNARGGSRYVEYVYTQYGVIQPDILSRPEYLGGTHQRLTVQPVVQNSSTDSNSPQGTLTGIIYGANSEHGFVRSFTEHGYIIGIMNVYSDLTYFQGLDRHWSFSTPLDIPLPVFANLTDEAILNKEIVTTGTDSDNEIFGYAERYSFAKYSRNTLSGLVRPNAPLTIGQWSLAEMFSSVPKNTSDFIQMNTPISRIEAVNSPNGSNNAHAFIVNQKFSGNVVRCLPAYSDPMKWFMRV
ncbi:major capsid protein [Sigmofec virus UA08Rod_4769]|uniref:Major capsid protein n=1 Tax=Sigmofec virus UA08Rod_4769 TaxID=2929408 RepID=A0A976R8M7_9VIRU|nr:major capsid protein [Sigmofec virus UA08Rod_4769]